MTDSGTAIPVLLPCRMICVLNVTTVDSLSHRWPMSTGAFQGAAGTEDARTVRRLVRWALLRVLAALDLRLGQTRSTHLGRIAAYHFRPRSTLSGPNFSPSFLVMRIDTKTLSRTTSTRKPSITLSRMLDELNRRHPEH